MFAPSEATVNINWALSPPPSIRSLSLQGGIKDREVAEPSVTTIDTNLTNPTLLLFESSGRLLHREKFETKKETKEKWKWDDDNFLKISSPPLPAYQEMDTFSFL